MIAEYDGSNVLQRRFVHGPGVDEPLVHYEGTGTSNRSWLHADERGSVIALSDGAGNVTAINKYDEYGKPQSTNAGRFQYTGQMWLAEIGAYYYKARIYSPVFGGRFLQTDPAGYGGGLNLYAYVLNSPTSFTDPLGLVTCTGSRINYDSCENFAGGPLSCSGDCRAFAGLSTATEQRTTPEESALDRALVACVDVLTCDLLQPASQEGLGGFVTYLEDDRYTHILMSHGISAAIDVITGTGIKGILNPILYDRDYLEQAAGYVIIHSPEYPGSFPGYFRYEAELTHWAGISISGLPTDWLTVITRIHRWVPNSREIWTIYAGRFNDKF